MWDRIFEIISLPKLFSLIVIAVMNVFYATSLKVFLRAFGEGGIVEGDPVLMLLGRSPERIQGIAFSDVSALEIVMSLVIALVVVFVNGFLFRAIAFLSSYALNERYAYWKASFGRFSKAEMDIFLLDKGKQVEHCERNVLIWYSFSSVVFSAVLIFFHQATFVGSAYVYPFLFLAIYLIIHLVIVFEVVSKYIPSLALHDARACVVHNVAKRIMDVTR